jgi:pimeloyl-ACP methyl ester carboxylesterase
MKKIKFRKRYILYFVMISYLIICQSCMKMRLSSIKTKTFFTTSKIEFIDSVIKLEEHSVHYIQTGHKENPTLFFIHGSPGSWDAYKEYLKDTLLLKKYRMIAIDRPGFGYSDFGTAENLQVQSKIIYDFIKKVDNDRPIILVGHSMGGPVVTKLAIDNPDKYNHLVILSGSIDPKAENPENWRYFIMKKPIRYLIPGALRPANDELWWLKKDLILMKTGLKKIVSNVTIIHGTKDQLVPFSNMKFMQLEFMNAKKVDTISIKDANHFIPWTHFEIIRNALLDIKI